MVAETQLDQTVFTGRLRFIVQWGQRTTGLACRPIGRGRRGHKKRGKDYETSTVELSGIVPGWLQSPQKPNL